jgi:hypothetical protein
MDAQRKGPPRRQTGNGPEINGKRSGENHTTPAAVRAFRRELWIILQAAHRMAAGYGITGDDMDRLHQAHQFILTVLEAADE